MFLIGTMTGKDIRDKTGRLGQWREKEEAGGSADPEGQC